MSTDRPNQRHRGPLHLQCIETRTEECDRARPSWGEGPWQSEPDRIEWRSDDIVCLMNRVPTHGAWCGYVGVPPGHPWHGKGYDEIEALAETDVHGGLTYSNECRGDICHVPAPGEPEHLWWAGFDCAHGLDLVPGHQSINRLFLEGADVGVYRDVAYVEGEVDKLAALARSAS